MHARLLLIVHAVTLLVAAVQQSPGLAEVKKGSSVRLECSTDGMPATFCYAIIWTKIDARGQKLVTFKNNATSRNGDSGAQTTCFFRINNARVEDSGTYYCLVMYGKMVYIGNGSKVIVTGERKSAHLPIEILWPSGVVQAPFTQLLCSIPRLSPEVRMFWVIDGQVKSGFTENTWTKDDSESVELTQNQVLISTERWEKGVECTCVVEFNGRNTSKTVRKGVTDNWETCYPMVVPFRVVVTLLCLLSWIMTLTAGICLSRKQIGKCRRRTVMEVQI